MPEKTIVVATDDEYNRIRPLTKLKMIKTGIGFVNAINALKDLDKSTPLVNIGYAGSNILPRGTVSKIGKCKPYHPISLYNYPEPEFNLGGNVDCFTAGDFVVNTDIKTPVVFDMELASICALGFKNIASYKVVSDTLNIDEYEQANFSECFEKIIKEIEEE